MDNLIKTTIPLRRLALNFILNFLNGLIFWIVHFLVWFKNWVNKSTDSLFTFNFPPIEVNPTEFLCPAKPHYCRKIRKLADLTGYFKSRRETYFHDICTIDFIITEFTNKTHKMFMWQLRIFGCFPSVGGGDGLETKDKSSESNETGTAKMVDSRRHVSRGEE